MKRVLLNWVLKIFYDINKCYIAVTMRHNKVITATDIFCKTTPKVGARNRRCTNLPHDIFLTVTRSDYVALGISVETKQQTCLKGRGGVPDCTPGAQTVGGLGSNGLVFFFFLLFFLLMTKFRKNYKVPPAVFHVWTGPPIEPGPHGAQPASPQCWQQTRLTGHFTSFFKWHTRTYLENPPVTIFKILHPVPSWNNLVVLVHNFHGQSTMGCL